MDRAELLKLINEDDQTILSEQQLAEQKKIMEETAKQTELLRTIVEQTRPVPPSPGLNNYMVVKKLDLNTTHDGYEVYRWTEGEPDINSVVIPAQGIDFEYEIEPGKRVTIEAGLIMDIGGHDIKLLRISHAETATNIMDIVLSGTKPA